MRRHVNEAYYTGEHLEKEWRLQTGVARTQRLHAGTAASGHAFKVLNR